MQQPQEPQRPPYEQMQWAGMQYDISPPPMEYVEYQYNPYEKISEHRPGIIFRIIKGIFYFIAIFITAFGLFGAFTSFEYSSLISGLGLFFMFGSIVAGVVLFLLMRRRITKLRRGQFILWIFGATVALVMAWILEYAFIPHFSGPFGSFIFWCIFILYGLVLAAIALW